MKTFDTSKLNSLEQARCARLLEIIVRPDVGPEDNSAQMGEAISEAQAIFGYLPEYKPRRRGRPRLNIKP